jgi:hypothetical protein
MAIFGSSGAGLVATGAGAATGNPLAIAALGISAAGLLMGFLGSKKASKAAKKEGAEEARLEGLVTDEKLRNLRTEERSMYGETLAGYAGGGVQAVAPGLEGSATPQIGSPEQVLNEQAKAFKAQRDITSKVGATKAQQSLTRGSNIADQYRYSGYANVASGISNILSTYSAMKGP